MKISLLILLFFPLTLFSQKHQAKIIQLSGVVQAKNSGEPVAFATISVVGTPRGTIADENGFYSLPVKSYELISISAIGFVNIEFSVTKPNDKNLTINHLMDIDNIELPEAVVYPWPKKQYLKQEFLAINVKDDLKVKIQENLTKMQHILKEELEKPSQFYGIGAQDELKMLHSKNYYQGQTNPDHLKILNPIAWFQYFKSLDKKSKKKK